MCMFVYEFLLLFRCVYVCTRVCVLCVLCVYVRKFNAYMRRLYAAREDRAAHEKVF